MMRSIRQVVRISIVFATANRAVQQSMAHVLTSQDALSCGLVLPLMCDVYNKYVFSDSVLRNKVKKSLSICSTKSHGTESV